MSSTHVYITTSAASSRSVSRWIQPLLYLSSVAKSSDAGERGEQYFGHWVYRQLGHDDGPKARATCVPGALPWTSRGEGELGIIPLRRKALTSSHETAERSQGKQLWVMA